MEIFNFNFIKNLSGVQPADELVIINRVFENLPLRITMVLRIHNHGSQFWESIELWTVPK
jgi:hypothetical protein